MESTVYDLAEVASIPGLAALEFRPEVDSTNTWALALAREADRRLPILVLADRQTGGRGRGANRWWSSDGAMTFSLLVDPQSLGISPARVCQIALATGVGVEAGLRRVFPPGDFALKWPNDVFLSGRKLGGILVEATSAIDLEDGPPRPRVVVGIGLNVNNAFREAPPDVRARAISLCERAGGTFDLNETLTAVVHDVLGALARLAVSPEEVLESFAARSWLTGKVATIEAEGRRTTGRCVGIDPLGFLVLQTTTGPVSFNAGVVVGWEESPSA